MFICARYCLVSLILPGWSAWLILIWSLWFDQLALSVLLCPPHKMLDTNYSLCPHIAYEGGTCERYWQQAFSPWGFCCYPVAFCGKEKGVIFTHHEVFLPCVKVEKICTEPSKNLTNLTKGTIHTIRLQCWRVCGAPQETAQKSLKASSRAWKAFLKRWYNIDLVYGIGKRKIWQNFSF